MTWHYHDQTYFELDRFMTSTLFLRAIQSDNHFSLDIEMIA